MKNASYHTGIKRTPYTAPRVGLTSSSITVEIIERLETEDDLRKALSVPPTSADDLPPPQPDDHIFQYLSLIFHHHHSMLISFQSLSLTIYHRFRLMVIL
ncbi:hypothetical protein Pmani_002572 [Petrolisthes manimaculis]|uniref:Uncharacterized protein n=1 Tax=Petrolisthes manimaculis TaxID=1843537 RepID=A0AAE1UQV5_9EUCA|nr:hypothetical protein Pmani_002572 [Petrolisthes manimaculis]